MVIQSIFKKRLRVIGFEEAVTLSANLGLLMFIESKRVNDRRIGFSGKLCIHPAQVPLAAAVFRPTTDEVSWATAVIKAYEAALARGDASVAVDGEMVDEPVVRRARALLADAG